RGGGASEASQKTTVDSLRSYGPRPLGTSCHSPTPLTASWGRNPLPQRQGRPTPLPRGAAAERGSTAGGGEGARAKRARNPTVISLRSCGPRPLGTSCHSPTPLTASWGRSPLLQRRYLPPAFGRGTNPERLPRGAAAERGSTAGGGEGARAKRARKPPWVPCGPADRAPSALRATPPLR